MPRPRHRRRISFDPEATFFKPAGVPMRELEEITIEPDELEVLRLKDFLGLDQKDAADMMEISQPTFHRTLLVARKKVSQALVEGKAIVLKKTN
ncbi:DUF134 domain-containing protein [Candidatus Woesearchaeota archaeon]|nr:DUF134 domain-containing protein [Candidatus Woesearchaeota archaeon]